MAGFVERAVRRMREDRGFSRNRHFVALSSPEGRRAVRIARHLRSIERDVETGWPARAERRDGGEYFAEAMGPHPIPLVRDWAEAPGLMSDLRADGRAEEVRRACHAWWRARKQIVRSELAAALA